MRRVLPGFIYTSQNLEDLTTLVANYREHLRNIYEMEMYYGDQTLHGLVDHAQSFNEQLETFEFIYSLVTLYRSRSSLKEAVVKVQGKDQDVGETQSPRTTADLHRILFQG